MPSDVRVEYHVADTLPGGVPVLFAANCAERRLDVIYSRAVTIDEIAAAIGPMMAALNSTTYALHAVA